MLQLVLPAEYHISGQPERPLSIQAQASTLLLSNVNPDRHGLKTALQSHGDALRFYPQQQADVPVHWEDFEVSFSLCSVTSAFACPFFTNRRTVVRQGLNTSLALSLRLQISASAVGKDKAVCVWKTEYFELILCLCAIPFKTICWHLTGVITGKAND